MIGESEIISDCRLLFGTGVKQVDLDFFGWLKALEAEHVRVSMKCLTILEN
jgi:hypothetical protein